ncbi:MAG: signal peptidase II [Desulfobacterota bacterium]|nr:signal peptidase II [Thermodesulfobacteriota bacterium]MDW8001779.1 signal peptidase II [Deltaproteobacteria bacterium]
MRRYSLFLISAFVFVLDQVTKKLIEKNLPYGQEIEYLPFFSLVHVKNYGGAFSLLSGSEYSFIVFTLLPLLVVGTIFFLLIKGNLVLSQRVALLLILGGALGNLYDRITKGYVLDFLDFHYRGFHWPAFNVADTGITAGVILFLLRELSWSLAWTTKQEKKKEN